MPTRSQYDEERVADTDLPKFKPDALTSLAKKIHESLGKHGLESKKNVKRKTTKGKEKGEKKVPLKPPTSGNVVTPNSTEKVDSSEKGQGKKRLRNGQVKRDESKHNAAPKKAQRREIVSKPGKDGDSKLRDDILALGGTEEDYRLIQDAGSDSEIEGTTNRNLDSNPDRLKNDLLRLASKSGAHNTTNVRKVKVQLKPGNDVKNAQHPQRTQEAVSQSSHTNGPKSAHNDVKAGVAPRLVSTRENVATHGQRTDNINDSEVSTSVSLAHRLFARITFSVQTGSTSGRIS